MTTFLHHILGAAGQVVAASLLLVSVWWLTRSGASSIAAISELLIRFFALTYAAFEISGSLGLFTPPAMIAFGLATSAVAWMVGSRGPGTAHRYVSASDLLWMPRSTAILMAVPGGLALSSLLRAVAAPPLAWDDLTYHLVKGASFVQAGGFTRGTGPDAWDAYAFYPHAGEAIWGFFMLFGRSDVLVPLVSIVVTGLASASVVILARELGADREPAFLAGAFIFVTPSVLSLAGTGYVDNLLLTFWISAVAFAIRHARTGAFQDGATAAVAGAMAASTKLTGGVVAVLIFGFLASTSLRRGRAAEAPKVTAYLALSLLGCFGYLRTWIETGSPVYPVPLGIGGMTLFPGNALWIETHSLSNPAGTPVGRLLYLLFGTVDGAYLGPGIGALFLPFLFVPGLMVVWRRRGPRRQGLIVALFSAAWLLWTFLDPMHRALLDVWAPVSGRLLSPVLGLLVAVAACAPGARPVLLALTFLQPLLGWLPPTANELLPIGGVMIIGTTAAAGLLLVALRWGPSLHAAGAAIAIIATATAALATWRDEFRHAYYEQARIAPASLPLPHALNRRYVAAEAWRSLDTDESLSIAHAAGFDGIGHNWYRYPLLGSRLQNRVSWVSPASDDAEAFSYVDPQAIAWSSWVSRLTREGVDFVVLTPPYPPEAHAIQRRCPAAVQRQGIALVARVEELRACTRSRTGIR